MWKAGSQQPYYFSSLLSKHLDHVVHICTCTSIYRRKKENKKPISPINQLTAPHFSPDPNISYPGLPAVAWRVLMAQKSHPTKPRSTVPPSPFRLSSCFHQKKKEKIQNKNNAKAPHHSILKNDLMILQRPKRADHNHPGGLNNVTHRLKREVSGSKLMPRSRAICAEMTQKFTHCSCLRRAWQEMRHSSRFRVFGFPELNHAANSFRLAHLVLLLGLAIHGHLHRQFASLTV